MLRFVIFIYFNFSKITAIQTEPSSWYIENFHDLLMVEQLRLTVFERMLKQHTNSNSIFDKAQAITPEFELIASELRKSLQNVFQTRQRSLEKIVQKTQQIFQKNDQVIQNTTKASMADKKNNRIYSDSEIRTFNKPMSTNFLDSIG